MLMGLMFDMLISLTFCSHDFHYKYFDFLKPKRSDSENVCELFALEKVQEVNWDCGHSISCYSAATLQICVKICCLGLENFCYVGTLFPCVSICVFH